MGRISVKGVLLGGVVDVVTSFLLGIPFAIYAVTKVSVANIPKAQVAAALKAVNQGNALLHFGPVIIGLACSVLGGYIAAWIAKHDELLNGTLSAFLCVGLGIVILSAHVGTEPFWFQLLLSVASPVCALLGGELRRRQTKTRVLMSSTL